VKYSWRNIWKEINILALTFNHHFPVCKWLYTTCLKKEIFKQILFYVVCRYELMKRLDRWRATLNCGNCSFIWFILQLFCCLGDVRNLVLIL
jgi:hypothetical protein